MWVKERKPDTSADAARLADDYEQARKQTDNATKKTGRTHEPRLCYACGKMGHMARDCMTKSKTEGLTPAVEETQLLKTEKWANKSELKCFNWGQKGHISGRCPSNAALLCEAGRRSAGSRVQSGMLREGLVEGQAVTGVLLDTGCSQTLVKSDLVPTAKRVEGDAVTIRCAHGDTVLYPLANVELVVDGIPLQVEAAVSDTLPVSVLLGTDVPELDTLLEKQVAGAVPERVKDALVVTTRAQARRREADNVIQLQREAETGAQVTPTTTPASGPDETANADFEGDIMIGSNFSSDFFTPGRMRPRLSRREKRLAQHQYATAHQGADDSGQMPLHALEISAGELQRLQKEDDTLVAANNAADGDPSTAGVGFFRRDGLLYRRWQLPGQDSEALAVEQLVLPQACRPTVLALAHTIPLAGHLGSDKITRRVLQRFYWPTLFRDVANYCKHCTVPTASELATRRCGEYPLSHYQ